MLTSISPLGERARGHRWWLTTTSYVVGSAVGGLLIGLVLGLLGAALDLPVRLAAAILLLCAVVELAGRLPHGRRQVDREWLDRYRGGVYGFGFGVQLGVGVVTIVTSAATYAFLGVALASGSGAAGAAIGLTFGVVRALPLLLMARAADPAAVRVAARRFDGLSPALRPVTVAALVAAGALVWATT